MANLTDAPEFTANEIYEMQQTDGCEAAAAGASFGGIGVNNQPHQQLANRTAFLKNRQDVNIGNIGTLLAFMAKFVSLLAGNGYLKIPVTDINLGAQVLIVQWGEMVLDTTISVDTPYAVDWPLAFPNECLFALPAVIRAASLKDPDDNWTIEVLEGTLSNTGGQFEANYFSQTTGNPMHIHGFVWIAIGY